MASSKRRYLMVGLVVVVAVAGAMLARNNGRSKVPEAPDTAQTLRNLKKLKVAPALSMAGYSPDKFPHWTARSEHCDTRAAVIKRDGSGVQVGARCKLTTGDWRSPYDGEQVIKASDLTVDWVVPLGDAWRSGAASWSTARRRSFANDMKHPELLAVTRTSVRSKNDRGPSGWLPPDEGFRCEYARDWVAVKRAWKLTITRTEKAVLTKILGKCT